MLRFVSLVGLAVLTLAAVAVATTPRLVAEEPRPEDNSVNAESQNRFARTRTGSSVLSFHAPFSLN
jgi:hypothetical protein